MYIYITDVCNSAYFVFSMCFYISVCHVLQVKNMPDNLTLWQCLRKLGRLPLKEASLCLVITLYLLV